MLPHCALLTLTLLAVVESSDPRGGCLPPAVIQGSRCLAPAPSATVACESPFIAVGDQCLYFATFAQNTYQESSQLCHSVDGELAAINTATQLRDIAEYIYFHGLIGVSYWIDGSNEAGTWLQSSGQPVPMGTPFWAADSDFSEQKPDSWNGDCLELGEWYFYYMNNKNCSNGSSPLCEQTPSNVTATELPRQGVCPDLFVELGGMCLSFVTWADLTWTEARQTCHSLDGELAAINDPEVLRAISLYLHQEGIVFNGFWLGGSDEAVEGDWAWTDSSPVPRSTPFWALYHTFDMHDSTQLPFLDSYYNCLAITPYGFHYFQDLRCDLNLHPLCMYTA